MKWIEREREKLLLKIAALSFSASTLKYSFFSVSMQQQHCIGEIRALAVSMGTETVSSSYFTSNTTAARMSTHTVQHLVMKHETHL